MERGYIKIWRKTLDSRVFCNAELFQLWMYCLLKANHKDEWVPIKTGTGYTEILVKEGQFIFGRIETGKHLRQNPFSTYKRLLKLKNLQFLHTKSNNKYTIVTICNWDIYQNKENQKEQQKEQGGNKEGTRREQGGNTNKNNKNDKNKEKNYIKKENKKNAFDDVYKHYPRKQGKKQAIRHFNASVKTEQDFQDIQTALKNYLASREVKDGYIQYASTWFNNWRDWVDAQNTANNAVLSNSYLLACQTQKNEKKQQKQRIQAILSGKPTVQTIANYILHHPEDENQVMQAIADKTLKRGVKENLTAERNKFSQMITQITKKLPSISKTGG